MLLCVDVPSTCHTTDVRDVNQPSSDVHKNKEELSCYVNKEEELSRDINKEEMSRDVNKEVELSRDVDSSYFFVIEPTTDRSLTSTAPVVEPLGEGHDGTVRKRSFCSTSSLTHRVRKVQSKKTDLENEQE